MGLFERFKKKAEPLNDTPEDEIKTFVFESIPKNLEEMKSCRDFDLKDAFSTTAFLVLALNVYPENSENALQMLDYLNGPNPVDDYGRQFLKDRFLECNYVPRSFFEGAVPENCYKPVSPYTIKIIKKKYSQDQDGYATLWVKSGGAEFPRSVTLRKKCSTCEWFVNSYQLLGKIETPKSLDPWA